MNHNTRTDLFSTEPNIFSNNIDLLKLNKDPRNAVHLVNTILLLNYSHVIIKKYYRSR